VAGRITVVGLGPAGAELITVESSQEIAAHSRRFVRTRRHPASRAVSGAVSFDYCYEQAETFEDVYEAICERLLDACAQGDVLYAVPGSPMVLERTVELLRERCSSAGSAHTGVELRILPAMSFLDLAWARLGIDPAQEGVRIVDGLRFAESAAGCSGPLLVAHCHARWVMSDVKLAVESEPESAVVLQRLGLADETIREIAWADLDRAVDADHLTSVYVPELAEPVAAEIVRFDELVRTLRQRCPWDREQTHASLRRHLLEETYETLEAIDGRVGLADDEIDERLDGHLEEELGDLLYQVWFQARLAAERGAFTISDVARRVHDKLVERHPHVFGDARADSAEQVRANWETRKRREKGRASVLDGIPETLPALLRAVKLLKRADAAGLTPQAELPADQMLPLDQILLSDQILPPDQILHRAVTELVAEPCERHMGDVLLAAVELARRLNLDPEDALRTAAGRAERSLRAAERR